MNLDSQYSFSGCHSLLALQQFVKRYPNAEYVIADKKYRGNEGANSPYSGKPILTMPNGEQITKRLNFGRSNFFPDSWSEKRILEEVEHAVSNNMGFIPGTSFLIGPSKDGSFEIQIGFDRKRDSIDTYYPVIW